MHEAVRQVAQFGCVHWQRFDGSRVAYVEQVAHCVMVRQMTQFAGVHAVIVVPNCAVMTAPY